MNEPNGNERSALFHDAVVFQLKLMADGLRDLVLMPVSLIAAVAGLLRGGAHPDREFRQVLEMGQQTERWINLFGNHTPESGASLDQLLERAEQVVREQAQQGGISESASRAIERALAAAQRAAAPSGEEQGKPDAVQDETTDKGAGQP